MLLDYQRTKNNNQFINIPRIFDLVDYQLDKNITTINLYIFLITTIVGKSLLSKQTKFISEIMFMCCAH